MFFFIVTSTSFIENTLNKHVEACFFKSILVLIYIFETST